MCISFSLSTPVLIWLTIRLLTCRPPGVSHNAVVPKYSVFHETIPALYSIMRFCYWCGGKAICFTCNLNMLLVTFIHVVADKTTTHWYPPGMAGSLASPPPWQTPRPAGLLPSFSCDTYSTRLPAGRRREQQQTTHLDTVTSFSMLHSCDL